MTLDVATLLAAEALNAHRRTLDGPRTPEQPQPGTQRHPNQERTLGDHQ